jgi:hypothetical protein
MIWLFACTEPDDSATKPVDSEEPAVLDLTQDYPDSTEGFLVLETDIIEVAPYTEIMQCVIGTWTEDTIGVISYLPQQAASFGHHAQLFSTQVSAEEAPDGVPFDCTHGGFPVDPLFQPVDLPQGSALALKNGVRWAIQSHYVNTSDQTILVNDAILMDTVPASEVTTWAASYNFADAGLVVPEGVSEQVFSCRWPVDLELLSVAAHMHENGTWYRVDHTDLGGTTKTIMSLDAWEDEWRDKPPFQDVVEGELVVKAGESFTVHCGYNNETGAEIIFPSEMCVAFGIGQPSMDAVNCSIL